MSLTRLPYGHLISERQIGLEGSIALRVLHERGQEQALRLSCEGGNCALLVEASSGQSREGGGASLAFYEFDAVFEDEATLKRDLSLWSIGSAGLLKPFDLEFVKGEATFLSSRNPGELVTVDKAGATTLSTGLELFAPLSGPWLLDDGSYRFFGSSREEVPHVATAPPDGTGNATAVEGIDRWGRVTRCGNRFLIQASNLPLSVDEAADEFFALSDESSTSFAEIRGCTEKWAYRFQLAYTEPFELVSLSDGFVLRLPELLNVHTIAAVSRVGDGFGLFRVLFEKGAIELSVVDGRGVWARHQLPLPEGLMPASITGIGDGRFVVPDEMDSDLSHVSLVWTDVDGRAWLSSWSLSGK